MSDISRQAYADMFGPTTGDKVRLADTELWIEVEDDLTTYGEEVKFGGGKVIRDGMGQGQMLSAGCVDLVLTNALIVDYWGIVKADIGVKDGRIFAIGKAGNPDIQPNVTIPIGAYHGNYCGGRQDRHRRRRRYAYSLDLSAAGGRGAGLRRHHHDRRRDRPGGGHQRHDLHARAVVHLADAAGRGQPAGQYWPAG